MNDSGGCTRHRAASPITHRCSPPATSRTSRWSRAKPPSLPCKFACERRRWRVRTTKLPVWRGASRCLRRWWIAARGRRPRGGGGASARPRSRHQRGGGPRSPHGPRVHDGAIPHSHATARRSPRHRNDPCGARRTWPQHRTAWCRWREIGDIFAALRAGTLPGKAIVHVD